MKKDLTELVLILDESGSMCDLTDDTIGGFNSMIESQKKEGGEVLVTTYLFNSTNRMIHDRVSIGEIKPMTRKDYAASGCTALLDCLGTAIKHISSIHRYAREEDVPENTIFVITTDGMENSSSVFGADEIRKMIRHEEEKYGWQFIYLASNIDAVENAERVGIGSRNAVDYMPDSVGVRKAYGTVNSALSQVRTRKVSLNADMSWRESTDEDFKARKK